MEFLYKLEVKWLLEFDYLSFISISSFCFESTGTKESISGPQTQTQLIIQKNDKIHVTIYHCEFYLGRSNGPSSSVTTYLQKLAVKLCSAGNRMSQDRVNICVTLRLPNASRLWHVFSIHGKKFSELCLEKMWLNYNVSVGGGRWGGGVLPYNATCQ
jgi:hypothetical protein